MTTKELYVLKLNTLVDILGSESHVADLLRVTTRTITEYRSIKNDRVPKESMQLLIDVMLDKVTGSSDVVTGNKKAISDTVLVSVSSSFQDYYLDLTQAFVKDKLYVYEFHLSQEKGISLVFECLAKHNKNDYHQVKMFMQEHEVNFSVDETLRSLPFTAEIFIRNSHPVH